MRGRGVESAEGTLFWTVQLNLSVSAGIMTLSLCFHMEQDIITILSRSYDEYFGFNKNLIVCCKTIILRRKVLSRNHDWGSK